MAIENQLGGIGEAIDAILNAKSIDHAIYLFSHLPLTGQVFLCASALGMLILLFVMVKNFLLHE